MIIDRKNLPHNIDLLHQIIGDLLEENGDLKHQLSLLKKKRYGKSSEKLDKQISDLERKRLAKVA